MLPVLILLGAILLALPGLAPYVHGFVSVVEYPAYAYFTWRLSIWATRAIVTRTGMFTSILTGSKALASWWHKVARLGSSVLSSVRRHLSPFGIRLSNVSKLVARFRSISSYPLSFIVGLLIMIAMWRCALKMFLLGGLGVYTLVYVYFVIISRLARSLLSLRLVHWILPGLTLGHMFARNDFSERDLKSLMKWTILTFILHEDILVRELCDFSSFLRGAFRQCAFRLVRLLVTRVYIVALRFSCWIVITRPYLLLRRLVRLLLKHVIVPTVRLIVFKTVCWAFTCELFAALLEPLYYAHLLFHRWYKSREEASSVPQPLALSIEQEEFLSRPQPPSRPSKPATSKGVQRLGHFINAYLDQCASAEQVVQLEGQLKNTTSIHAPHPSQATPPTPSFSPTVAPVPRSPTLPPVPPVETTVAGDPSPGIAFEPVDEDEEMVALADRLSRFHIEFEAGLVPRRSRRVSQSSTITFGAYGRSLDTPLMTSPHERWVNKRFEAGCVAYMQMRK
ncbi:hypothetical protein RhiJN_27798 [Ceratobasidium sp. AG-Ba]|nr:hypothetical protein RhiJN_27798 [Ceratobasidium sp. AG-Ba]